MAYKAKILLIEDEELSQITTRALLESLGCNVDAGSTGAEGVRLFEKSIAEQNSYDLIFIDLKIFDMDGFKVARKIIELQKNDKKIPMIVLTGHTEESMKRKAKKLGFKAYIMKPLSEDDCRKVLQDFIHKELADNSNLLQDNSGEGN